MNKIMKFENTPIDVQVINSVPMFELYSVGMALGYARSNGKSGGEHGVHPENKKLFPYKSRIDKVVKNAEIKPCVRNAHKYITESQLYDLMLEARTDKCRAFRKWLTNEVLPELNHTGTYTMPKKDKQLELYNYFDKKYNGEAVLSIADVEHFTGLSRYSILKALKTGVEFMDYYYLKRDSLQRFKIDNPKISKLVGEMYVITRSGFELICKWYGIKIDYPDAFLRDMFSKRKAIEPPKQNVVTPVSERQKRINHIMEMVKNLFDKSSCEAEQDILPQINTKDYDVILLVHK